MGDGAVKVHFSGRQRACAELVLEFKNDFLSSLFANAGDTGKDVGFFSRNRMAFPPLTMYLSPSL